MPLGAPPLLTMSQASLNELAEQGDNKAMVASSQGADMLTQTAEGIATLLNRSFEPKGVTAKAAIKNDGLHIILEATETPHQKESLSLIRELVSRLKLESLKTVSVYGRQIGDEIPDWHETFLLANAVAGLSPKKAAEDEPFSFGSLTRMVSGIGESIGNTTSHVGKAVVETATGVGEVVGKTTFATGKVFVDTAAGVGKAVSDTAFNSGKAMVETAVGLGGAFGNSVSQVSQAAAKTAVGVGGTAAKHTYHVLAQITQFVAGAPILRKVVDQVDLVKVEESVRKLKQKYPNETPRQIAHRFMLEKAIYAGSTGLVTSLVPGAAAALFVVDLTATSALQAEMVYQIAAAYGLNIREPVRKGEALTIFGLALGGNRAVKAGLELLQNTPVAGAVIGASSNAVMLYTVGYAACRFYEAKLDSEATEATLAASKEASEDYLKTAIAQQIIMDQILVHVICAGNPRKSWEDVLPELEALNISPASLSVIKANIKSPPSLEGLLAQLSRDFAVPLLAQCDRIIQQDGVTTPEEAKVIEKISQKFQINLSTMKTQLISG